MLWQLCAGHFFQTKKYGKEKTRERRRSVNTHFFAKGVAVEHVGSLLPILKVRESQKDYYGCRFEITDSYTAKVSVQPSEAIFWTPVHLVLLVFKSFLVEILAFQSCPFFIVVLEVWMEQPMPKQTSKYTDMSLPGSCPLLGPKAMNFEYENKNIYFFVQTLLQTLVSGVLQPSVSCFKLHREGLCAPGLFGWVTESHNRGFKEWLRNLGKHGMSSLFNFQLI